MVSTYGHAVGVLVENAYLSPLPGAATLNPHAGPDKVTPIPFALEIQTLFQTAARRMSSPIDPADPAPDIDLPLPEDPTANTYTKHQAVQVLSVTKKGSPLRGKMMRKMIHLGYAPTTTRLLRDLMHISAQGKPIPTGTWVEPPVLPADPKPLPSICLGIQSRTLDKKAQFHGEYCREKGWFVHYDQQWHSKGCTNDSVDKKGRCLKCRNVYSNINSSRHPTLFATPTSPSLLPKISDISNMVSSRVDCIDEKDVGGDDVLLEAAALLRLNECSRVDVGKSSVFILCDKCPAHRVCRKSSQIVTLCQSCQSKKWSHIAVMKRRAKNSELRVDPGSSVPFSALDKKEVSRRVGKMKTRRRSKAATLKRFKEKLLSQHREMEVSEQFNKHLNEALDYAVNNRDALEATLESSILQILQEEAGKDGTLDECTLILWVCR